MKIVIDPGHGGTKPNGLSTPIGHVAPSGVQEKDIVATIAAAVAARLGPQAVLTRTGDVNLALAERAAVAQREGAKLFVSLHANAGKASGPEAYVHERAGSESRALAERLHGALVALGRDGRGVRAAPMSVLDPDYLGPDVAACLLELDYLSDPAGEALLTQQAETVAAKLSEAIAPMLGQNGATIGAAYPVSRGLEVVKADYTPTDFLDAVRFYINWAERYTRWTAGVPNTTLFPHSAICKLYMPFTDGNTYQGTGWYIAPNRILTCAHNVVDPYNSASATSIRVLPGLDGSSQPGGSFQVTNSSDWKVYPAYNPARSGNPDGPHNDFANDLAIIKVPSSTAPSQVFDELEVLDYSPTFPIVVCGYSADTSVPNLDPREQNMDGDHIRELRSDDEVFNYNLQTTGGASGSPVYYAYHYEDDARQQTVFGIRAVGVHVARDDDRKRRMYNRACRFTDAKMTWIRQNTAGW